MILMDPCRYVILNIHSADYCKLSPQTAVMKYVTKITVL